MMGHPKNGWPLLVPSMAYFYHLKQIGTILREPKLRSFDVKWKEWKLQAVSVLRYFN